MDAGEVRRRATVSFFGLLHCSALSLLVQTVALGVLAALLSPRSLGAYGVAIFAVTSLTLLADLGLTPALVREPGEPSRSLLSAAFTLHMLLCTVAAGILVASAPRLAALYSIGPDGAALIRFLGLLVVLVPFRSIPALLLERRLLMEKIARVELVSAIAFHATAVCVAWLGGDIWSFAVAAAVRTLADVVQFSILAPWRPRVRFDRRELIPLLGFGTKVRLASLLCFAKDNASAALAGLVYGPVAVGYLNWALWFSGLPVLAVNQLQRVTFPAFARLRQSPASTASIGRATIRFSLVLGCGLSGLIAASAPLVVRLVYGGTWQPAIVLVVLLTPNMIAGYVTGTLMNLLWAQDRARAAVMVCALWTVTTWALAIGLLPWAGLTGMALAYSIASVTAATMLAGIAERTLSIGLRHASRGPMVASAGMAGVALLYTATELSPDRLLLPLVVGVTYTTVLVSVDGGMLRSDCRTAARLVSLAIGTRT